MSDILNADDGELIDLDPEQAFCAHCAVQLDLANDRITVAMTSRNTALLFHGECLVQMHSRAYQLTTDEHRRVLAMVQGAMEDG